MTDIEWCMNPDGTKGKTWNPTRGCSRVGPECDNCYAMRFAHRFSNEIDGKPAPYRGLTVLRPETASRPGVDWSGKVEFVSDMLDAPLRWRKPQRVFVNSMSDLFHESLGWERHLDRVFEVMEQCERHTFMILTKRAENMRDYVADRYRRTMARVAPNIWLGVSCGNKRDGLPRIHYLRDTLAAVRFLSIEPLLEDLGSLDLRGIHWSIIGGESGIGARPFDSAWAERHVAECAAAEVACFVKQLGGNHFASWKVEWQRELDGSLDAFSRDRIGVKGTNLATVWPNGVWHTWDAMGVGGENGEERTVELAQRAALEALQRQHIRPCKGWARHAHMLRHPKGGDMSEWPESLRVRQFPEVRT